jgi:TRAP-type C4-dicarboxylate transport system substrate-binding protein
MTVDAWNALTEADRKVQIEAVIELARKEAAEDRRRDEEAAAKAAAAKPQSYADLKKEAVGLGIEVKGNPKREELQALVDAKKAGG